MHDIGITGVIFYLAYLQPSKLICPDYVIFVRGSKHPKMG